MSTAPPSFRRAVVVAAAGVVAGVALFAGVLVLTSGDSDVELHLGDEVFRAGRADVLAERVERGGPLLFSDLAGGERDIFVQHLGAEPDEGWLAFSAHPRGEGRQCPLEWTGDAAPGFVDPCSGERYPPDGEGLLHYPARVEDGTVEVDLRDAEPAS